MHISTDYVFDGKGTRPYVETDATNPQGAYGSTKLAGENFVKDFADRYFILRTAWLYGDGKNFAKTMLRLSETNEKVRVVGDQFGSPTSASELTKRLMRCSLRKITACSMPPAKAPAAGRSLPGRCSALLENNEGGGDYHRGIRSSGSQTGLFHSGKPDV